MKSKNKEMSKSLKITNKIASILLLCVFFTLSLQSQVTIGSLSEPLNGLLLDLKEIDESAGDSNATKGIIYPRVSLTNLNELYPMLTGSEADYETLKPSYTGLTVYNVNTTTPFNKGLYSWNGVKWIQAGTVSGAKNGLSLTAGNDTVKLGGVLEENTTIDLDDSNLSFANSNGEIKIGTNDPKKPILDVNGVAAVSDSLIANGKLVLNSLAAAPTENVAQLAVDTKSGEVYAVRVGNNTKPFNYIKYTITCNNSTAAQRDWIANFDTQIPYADYTVFVVGSEFSIGTFSNGIFSETTNSGLRITTPNDNSGATMGPAVVEATKDPQGYNINNPTWRLKADYKYSGLSNTALYGQWTIHCIIINNSIVQQLRDIDKVITGSTWTEPSMPTGL